MIYQAARISREAFPCVTADLRPTPGAPTVARAALRRLQDEMSPAALETVELVLSELVTNAVRHSGAGADDHVEIVVRCGARAVRVEVTDPGPGFDPATRGAPRGGDGGWGLYVVGEVVERWWVEQVSGGTRVLAEIARD